MDLITAISHSILLVFSEYLTLGLCSISLIQQMFQSVQSLLQVNQKNSPCLTSILPLIFKFIFHVYRTREEDEAFSMLQDVLNSIPKEIFKLPNSLKILKLGEIASLHLQKKTLGPFTNQLLSTMVLEHLNVMNCFFT